MERMGTLKLVLGRRSCKNVRFIVPCLALVLMLGAGCTFGEPTPRPVQWKMVEIEPVPHAAVTALAMDPAEPRYLVAAVEDSVGIYISQDGGTTWQPTASGLEGRQVFALRFATGTPQVLLAGTGDGLFRSIDGGQAWAPVSLSVAMAGKAGW